MLGGGDPVGVDRLHVARVRLAAPADQEALRDRARLVDLALRHGRHAGPARRLRDERERHHGRAREVLARLVVGDVEQLLHPPLGAEHRERGLEVHARVSGADGERVRLGRRQAGLVAAVNQEAPDLLERDSPDQVLDVDAAVAEGAAFLVRLGDLRLEGDYALEAGLDLAQTGSFRSEAGE